MNEADKLAEFSETVNRYGVDSEQVRQAIEESRQNCPNSILIELQAIVLALAEIFVDGY